MYMAILKKRRELPCVAIVIIKQKCNVIDWYSVRFLPLCFFYSWGLLINRLNKTSIFAFNTAPFSAF